MWDNLVELLHKILMMGTELVPEMSIFNGLTQLIAQEDFINVIILRESMVGVSVYYYYEYGKRK
jgi:hypothetical protein